jgi:predicted O-methyltransferase YrrM
MGHPMLRRFQNKLVRHWLPIPVEARHAEYSAICSIDDDPARPSGKLIGLALEAVRHAQLERFDRLRDNASASLRFMGIWPGEHYRLLAGLVRALQPRLIAEIGTGAGMGCLAMRQALPPMGRIVTFDITDWRSHNDNVLQPSEFEDGRLIQHVDDVSQPEGFAKHRDVLESADFIFVDAAKDGVVEPRLLKRFETAAFRRDPIILFDDIRVWNMLRVWRSIQRPKLDLTSFGHWTGTGLVDWNATPE